MKWTKKELIQLQNTEFNFEEELTFASDAFSSMSNRLKDLRNVHVLGQCLYDQNLQRFEIQLEITGDMVIPCAITLEDVIFPFDIESKEIFSFNHTDDENVHYCKKDWIDLNPIVFQLIMAEVPLKVVKEDAIYPSGDGWAVMTEAEYQKSKGNEIDPRLAKLKEFKFDEN